MSVCSEAEGGAPPALHGMTPSAATYTEAALECAAQGQRLCTVDEAALCCEAGCPQYNSQPVWTSTGCAPQAPTTPPVPPPPVPPPPVPPPSELAPTTTALGGATNAAEADAALEAAFDRAVSADSATGESMPVRAAGHEEARQLEVAGTARAVSSHEAIPVLAKLQPQGLTGGGQRIGHRDVRRDDGQESSLHVCHDCPAKVPVPCSVCQSQRPRKPRQLQPSASRVRGRPAAAGGRTTTVTAVTRVQCRVPGRVPYSTVISAGGVCHG